MAEQNSISQNIWKFAALSVVDKRVYGAILSVYYLTIAKVEDFHIGWILLFGCIASFLFEIPSGYLSDKIGHKKTIVLSRVFFIISTLNYLLADNLMMLILGSVFFSLGVACMSGTSTAFIYDTLTVLKREKEYSKVMGKISAIGYAVPTLFMISSSFLASYDYRYIFMVSLVLDIIGLILSISLTQVKQSQEDKDQIKETKLKDVFAESFALGFIPFALLGSFMGGILIGIRGYVDPFQQISGADIALFGVFLGLSRLLSSVLSLYSDQIKQFFSIYSFHFTRVVIFSGLFIALGFVESWQAVVFIMIMINTINLGLHQVNNHYDLEIIGSSKFKATIMSIKGQAHQFFLAITTMSLGYMVTYYSYNQSFMFLGCVFFVICCLCFVYILKSSKTFKKDFA